MHHGIVPQGKTGGWSASGQFLSGSLTDEVTLQAVFKISENYTVEFNLIEEEVSIVPIRAEALITWSVEGNSVTRRVSVGNGVSVSGTGQGCRVVIKDTTDKTALPINLGKKYRVSVQFAPGVRASTQQPPTLATRPHLPAAAFLVLAGGTISVTVPGDAGVISVAVAASGVGAAPPSIPDQGIIVLHEQSGSILKAYDPRACCWVPVAPGATGITVTNNTANSVRIAIVFGIDG